MHLQYEGKISKRMWINYKSHFVYRLRYVLLNQTRLIFSLTFNHVTFENLKFIIALSTAVMRYVKFTITKYDALYYNEPLAASWITFVSP